VIYSIPIIYGQARTALDVIQLLYTPVYLLTAKNYRYYTMHDKMTMWHTRARASRAFSNIADTVKRLGMVIKLLHT